MKVNLLKYLTHINPCLYENARSLKGKLYYSLTFDNLIGQKNGFTILVLIADC